MKSGNSLNPKRSKRKSARRGQQPAMEDTFLLNFLPQQLTRYTRQKEQGSITQPFVILIPLVAITASTNLYRNCVQSYTLPVISSEPQRHTGGRHLTMGHSSLLLCTIISRQWILKYKAVCCCCSYDYFSWPIL